MRTSVMIIAAAVAAQGLWAAPIVGRISTENDTKAGAIKWSARAKAYVVTQKQAGTLVDVEVPEGDVTALEIAKPAGFDQAKAQVEKGQGVAAIPALTAIVKNYGHLQWDAIAGRYLAEAYLAANNAEKALEACKLVIDTDKSAAYKGDLAPAYWQALLKSNQKPKLEAALKKALAAGDRYSSGAALLMRGDIIMEEGHENADAARKALGDGYLRVVLMYKDPEVAAKLRPEGLYKAAQCFEKLGQSGRADTYRNELKKLYANSAWAAK